MRLVCYAVATSLDAFIAGPSGEADWIGTDKHPYDDPEGLSTADRCLYVGVATVPAMSVPIGLVK